MLALTIGAIPGHVEPDAVLAAVYTEHRAYLHSDLPVGAVPEGYWRYDPEVPADLRGDDVPAYPAVDNAEARTAHDALEHRRRAWLLRNPPPSMRPN
jgi:hypothetical protein